MKGEEENEKNERQNADSVVIFYGFNSFTFESVDKKTIKQISDYFNNLKFEPIEKEMELSTMLCVCFMQDQNLITKICVDKNNIFKFDGEDKCYQIVSGTFNYNNIKEIYEKDKEG